MVQVWFRFHKYDDDDDSIQGNLCHSQQFVNVIFVFNWTAPFPAPLSSCSAFFLNSIKHLIIETMPMTGYESESSDLRSSANSAQSENSDYRSPLFVAFQI